MLQCGLCLLCVSIQVFNVSQNFIFFVTYKWANKLERYITLKQERLGSDKLSSLLKPLVSYENKVL